MIRLVLLCQYGASTGMLAQRIKQAAAKNEIEISVDAYSYTDISKVVDKADVILLGPQIRFKKAEFEKNYASNGVPFVVIETTDYGMMNGENVLNSALEALKQSKGESL